MRQNGLPTSRAGGRRSGRRIQHPRFSIWSGALPSRRYDRSAKAEMRTLVCSYTSNVAFCRVLSRFGVFVASFLACARATGMQVAGCWRPCGPFWHLLALFGTLFSGAHGGGGLESGGQRSKVRGQSGNFTRRRGNCCKWLIEHPKLDRFWTVERHIFRGHFLDAGCLVSLFVTFCPFLSPFVTRF